MISSEDARLVMHIVFAPSGLTGDLETMTLPVFFRMFIELVSLFVVPVLYCGYVELKLGLPVAEDSTLKCRSASTV